MNSAQMFGLRNRFGDDWLITRSAAVLFGVSTVLVFGLIPILLGYINTSKMAFWERLPWAILGVLGPLAFFFLWFGMLRYWERIDRSKPWKKRFWFVALLLGFSYGGCLYYFFVYLPEVARRRSRQAA
jgi:hypothetical protein